MGTWPIYVWPPKSTTRWKLILIDAATIHIYTRIKYHSTRQEQSKTGIMGRSMQGNQTSRNCYWKKTYLASEEKVCADISPWITMRWERGGIQAFRILLVAARWWTRGCLVRRQYQWRRRSCGHRDRCRKALLLLTMGSETERRRGRQLHHGGSSWDPRPSS